MAITVERMIAVLEANNTKFDKAIAASTGMAVDEFGRVVKAGTAMETSLAGMGAKAANGLNQVTKSANALKGQTGNLAAQFNDIGVQLAGGQSPFLIALQQGTQITQVLGQGGARAAVSALGGAFLSLLNPLSLLTIATIALGGVAVQAFTDWLSAGEKTDEQLKAQADQVERVAKQWGDAVPALQAYVAALEKAKQVADLQAIQADKQAEAHKTIDTALDGVNEKYTGLIVLLQAAAQSQESVLHDLGVAFLSLRDKQVAGTASMADFEAVSTAAAKAAKETGGPDIIAFAGAFDVITSKVGSALATIQAFVDEAKRAENLAKFGPDDRATRAQIDDQARMIKEHEDLAAKIKADREKALNAKPKAEKTDAFEGATQSIQERTASLEAQRKAQEAVNPLVEDYGFAMEQAKAKADLLAAAEKAKTELTPEVIASIDQLSTAYAKASADMAKLAESQKLAAEAVAFQKSLLSGALDDMRAALEDGKLEWEDLGNIAANVLNKIADKLQSMLIDQLFSAMAPSGGGISSILSAIGLGGAAAAGGLSGGSGGATAASAAATGSTVGSAPATPPAAQMGASQKVSVESSVRVDEDGNWQARVEKISGAVSAGQGQAGLDHYRRNQMRVDVNRIAATRRVRGSI